MIPPKQKRAPIGVHTRLVRAPFSVDDHKFFAYNTTRNPEVWRIRDDYRHIQGLYGSVLLTWKRDPHTNTYPGGEKVFIARDTNRDGVNPLVAYIERKGISWDVFYREMSAAIFGALAVQSVLTE